MRLDEIKIEKKIDKGLLGKCYKLQNGDVFKKFNSPISVDDIDKYKYFLNYQNDSFTFPFDFVYDDVYFYGHISKFAFGEKMFNIFSKSDLINMSTHSIKLENNIKYVSSGNIIMFDFHDENLLYDGTKFTVIDHDEYCGNKSNLYLAKEIEDINIGYYKNIIKQLVIYNLGSIKDCKFILNKASKYKELKMSGSEMLYKIKEDLDRYFKEDIKTIDDVKKISR